MSSTNNDLRVGQPGIIQTKSIEKPAPHAPSLDEAKEQQASKNSSLLKGISTLFSGFKIGLDGSKGLGQTLPLIALNVITSLNMNKTADLTAVKKEIGLIARGGATLGRLSSPLALYFGLALILSSKTKEGEGKQKTSSDATHKLTHNELYHFTEEQIQNVDLTKINPKTLNVFLSVDGSIAKLSDKQIVKLLSTQDGKRGLDGQMSFHPLFGQLDGSALIDLQDAHEKFA